MKIISWQKIPDLGLTLPAMTPLPLTASSQSPGANSPRMEYRMYLFTSREIRVQAYFSPTNNFNNTEGLKYAISFDEELPQIINIHADNSNQAC